MWGNRPKRNIITDTETVFTVVGWAAVRVEKMLALEGEGVVWWHHRRGSINMLATGKNSQCDTRRTFRKSMFNIYLKKKKKQALVMNLNFFIYPV